MRGVVLVRLVAAMILLGSATPFLVAQRDALLGKLAGRILAPDGRLPASKTSLRILERRDSTWRLRARGRCDANGEFAVSIGAVADEFVLVADSPEFAPIVRMVRANPEGQGIWLGQLIHQKGASLSVSIDEDPRNATPGMKLRLLPRWSRDNIVDVEGEAILDVRFEKSRAVLSHVPEGEWVLLIHDMQASTRTQVIPWRMERWPVALPSVVLERGSSQTVEIVDPGSRSIDVVTFRGSGIYDPRGGSEFVIRSEPVANETSEGRFRTTLSHHGEGIVKLRVRSAKSWLAREFVIGDDLGELRLSDAVSVKGRIVDRFGGTGIAGAVLLVDGRTFESDGQGRFTIGGLMPDTYDLHVTANGYRSLVRPMRAQGSWSRTNLPLSMEKWALVEGRATDDRLQPAPGCLVTTVGTDDGAAGVLVFGESDAEGKFAVERLAAGEQHLALMTRDDRRGIVLDTRLEAGYRSRIDLSLAASGFVEGRVVHSKETPAAFADVFLAPVLLDPRVIYGRKLRESVGTPHIRQTVSSETGHFVFQNVEMGVHQVFARTIGRPMRLLGEVFVNPGVNAKDRIWELPLGPARIVRTEPGRPMRLVPLAAGLEEWWLSPGGDGTLDLSEMEPGLHRLERLALRPPTSTPSDASYPYPGDDIGEGHYHVNLIDGGRILRPPYEIPGGSVAGTVTLDGDVLGALRAEVVAYPLGARSGRAPVRTTTTAGAGTFRFDLPRGRWFLRVRIPEIGVGHAGPIEVAVDIDTLEIEDVLIDVRHRATISGRLDSSTDPQLFDGAWVRVSPRRDGWLRDFGDFSRWTAVESDGSFVVAGETDAVDLEVRAVLAFAAHTIDIGVDDAPRWDDIVLGHAPFEIGREAMPQGWIGSIASWPGRHWITHGNSSFVLEDASGFRDDGFPQVLERAQLAHFVMGPVWPARQPEDAVTTLKGLLEVDGKPLPFQRVDLYAKLGHRLDYFTDSLGMTTCDNGAWEMADVVPHDFVWSSRFVGKDGRTYRVHRDVAASELGGATTIIATQIRTGQLVVRVELPSDDEPVAGAVVRLVQRGAASIYETPPPEECGGLVVFGITGPEGEVRFETVPVGVYDLHVYHGRYASTSLRGIDVSGGDRAATTRMKTAVRGTIDVLAKNERGKAFPDCRVIILDVHGIDVEERLRLVTDHEGRCRVRGVAPGTYRVVVQAPGQAPEVIDRVEVFPGGTAIVPVSPDRPTGTLKLELKLSDGRPASYAKVQIDPDFDYLDKPWNHGRAESTSPRRADEQGMIAISGLSVGSYAVRVGYPGHLEVALDIDAVREVGDAHLIVLEKSLDR